MGVLSTQVDQIVLSERLENNNMPNEREGANLSKRREGLRAAATDTLFLPQIGRDLGRAFSPPTTEQEMEHSAAEARGTDDYMKQFKMWLSRFNNEYSAADYTIEDFLSAKERVLRQLPFSEGQERLDLTDDLAYAEAGEAHTQKLERERRRADAAVTAPTTMGNAVRNSLRSPER